MFLEKLCFGHSVFNYNVFTNICVALRHSVFNNNVFTNTLFFDKVLSIREAVKKLFFLGIIPTPGAPPSPIGTFRNKNLNFGQI